ncbi:hypothetical protein [Sessilibacter corallicola]|uniref:Lipoprotein n=1 Tax=Sessilibacter corallicola TaxID=2904075 RepID=A0ABQ0A9U1_9GAMM
MKTLGFIALVFSVLLSGCIVVPEPVSTSRERCEISSDRKTLRIVDLADETNSYYTIESYLLTPITVLTTGIVSGAYVAVNNIYYLGEKKIVCDIGKPKNPEES